jgi:hypothetical protein
MIFGSLISAPNEAFGWNEEQKEGGLRIKFILPQLASGSAASASQSRVHGNMVFEVLSSSDGNTEKAALCKEGLEIRFLRKRAGKSGTAGSYLDQQR